MAAVIFWSSLGSRIGADNLAPYHSFPIYYSGGMDDGDGFTLSCWYDKCHHVVGVPAVVSTKTFGFFVASVIALSK